MPTRSERASRCTQRKSPQNCYRCSYLITTGETCPCPKCGSGRILFYPKVAKCSNVDCTLTIFRNKCDKQLSDKQIVELVTKRKTGLIKGFKGKNGKAFDASLVLDEQFNVGFSFPEKKAKPKK